MRKELMRPPRPIPKPKPINMAKVEEELAMWKKDNLYQLAQLRHLYTQMVNGNVVDQKEAANGLLAPAIARFEQWIT